MLSIYIDYFHKMHLGNLIGKSSITKGTSFIRIGGYQWYSCTGTAPECWDSA